MRPYCPASSDKFINGRSRNLLRRRLFAQIYLVVVGGVLIVSFIAGALLHLGAVDGSHPPLLPLLGIAALVVSVAAYPVSRRLTYRLERLKNAVDALGEGDLGARVEVHGCDEVATLTQSFNRSAERIQSLLVGHRKLLANASHELRSPLTRLRMGLEILAEKHLIDEVEWLELRQDIRELDQLVEEILLASRLDIPELPLVRQPVDLAGLLAEECARLDAECEAQSQQIYGDPRLLRRMIRNLLENASRHAGRCIVARLARKQNQVSICILDRGPGIPKADRERVFEPFYRPAGHGEGVRGWGLGLSLVRQIARRHGGDVICSPREGGGMCFEVTLDTGD